MEELEMDTSMHSQEELDNAQVEVYFASLLITSDADLNNLLDGEFSEIIQCNEKTLFIGIEKAISKLEKKAKNFGQDSGQTLEIEVQMLRVKLGS